MQSSVAASRPLPFFVYLLDEIKNDITRETPASFEPTIDYVVGAHRASFNAALRATSPPAQGVNRLRRSHQHRIAVLSPMSTGLAQDLDTESKAPVKTGHG